MANLLPGFGALIGAQAVAPQNAGIPGFGAQVGGLTVPVTPAQGSKPNGTFAGSNLYAVANVGTKRSLLKKAGYSVDANGPATARLNQAWDNYFHTKGLGAAAWNITPTQFTPKGAPSNAKTLTNAGGGRTPAAATAPSAADQVPGAVPVVIPGSPNFENLYAGVKTPVNPITNLAQFASKYANDQANTQYNPIIAALNQGIGRQGTDVNAATQGIASLYKPVQDLATANVATAGDPAQQGIQGVQDVGTSIGQAFGLGPGAQGQRDNGLGGAISKATIGAVGNLEAQGADATAAAKAQQQIAAQGQVDSTNTFTNTEQQSINGLKDQLLQAISGRAAARASGVSAGMQLGQQTEGNYLGQLDQIATGKEQAAFADQSYVGGQLKNTGAALGNAAQSFQNKTAPLVLRDQLIGNAATRMNATKQLALQSKQFQLNNATAIAKAATAAGGWGQYLANPKNALSFASSMRSLLVDSKTGAPLAGLTPSSAYNTIAHTMASAGFPANTPQGQQLLVQALQGAGFDLTGYELDSQGRGLVLVPKAQPHALTSSSSKTPPVELGHNGIVVRGR